MEASREEEEKDGCGSSGRGVLELVDDALGVLLRARLAAQVARPGPLGDGLESRLVDPVGVRVELHVPEHHHTRQEESGRVRAAAGSRESIEVSERKPRHPGEEAREGENAPLAGNVGSGTVDGLKDRSVLADVAGRGQTVRMARSISSAR